MSNKADQILKQYKELYLNMPALYATSQVVNWFIRKAIETKKPISPMKLQKLVFFAHAKCLAKFNKRLVNEPAEAWKFGPVFPSAYHEYKYFGYHNITLAPSSYMVDYDEEQDKRFVRHIGEGDKTGTNMLNEIWEVYGEEDATTLFEWAHKEGSPWYQIWHNVAEKGIVFGASIPDALIQEYYYE